MQYPRLTSAVLASMIGLAGCLPSRAPAVHGAPASVAADAHVESERAHEVQAAYVTGEGPKTLAEARGLVVVVQFWSTYCDPCRRSFPRYQELLEEFPGELAVLGISVDEPELGAEQALRSFASETAVRFPLLWDTTGATQRAYRPRHLPTSYVIDQRGAVRFVHARYEAGTGQQMATEIALLLSR